MRHVLLGLMDAPDYYALFGLEPRLNLDLADLEDRFYRLSRRLHPDRYARATPAERERALETSAVLNDAYRTLRDPVARAGHLLARLGLAEQPDPELLDEMFELNLEVEQARRSGDAALVEGKLDALAEEAEQRLTSLFQTYDEAPSPDTLNLVRNVLTRLKYLFRLSSQVAAR